MRILRLRHRQGSWICILLMMSIGWIFFAYFTFHSSSSSQFLAGYSSKKVPAYIITLPGYDERVPTVTSLFQKYANLELQRYYGINGNDIHSNVSNTTLTPGEKGLRATMKLFFTMVANENYDKVFLFEDDAIPHINFIYLFNTLPRGCLEADVLLLGATIWQRNLALWPKKSCFDATNRTRGAFALLVKKSAFQSIISWLEEGPPHPFDHIYLHLQSLGITVRVAYPPFLVIADISHASSINNGRGKLQHNVRTRAAIHRWDLRNYPLSVIPTSKSTKA